MSLILGIDPGLDGALAVLDSRGSWTVHDTPTLTIKRARGSRRVYAVSSLTRLVTSAMSCDAPAVVRAGHCVEIDRWPSYPSRVCWAEPPAWAVTQFVARVPVLGSTADTVEAL